jgi:mRNA interferase YafQ
MKTLLRHKSFIKDMRTVRLTDGQTAKLFLYVANLLNDIPLPPESKDHALQGEWSDFREFHLGGDMLLIYKIHETTISLIRMGSHVQLFSKM